MRSDTGAVLSLGKGAVYGMSSKQKINTKSSFEVELVGVDDALPPVLWTLQFLKAQGFAGTVNVIYQDNQSTILLENNGTRSSGKRTRHLDIRYFFITHRVDKKEVRVKYCATEVMRADPHTKPLEGRLFREHRDWLLNTTVSTQVIKSQVCVGARLAREQELTTSQNGFDSKEGEWTTVVIKKVKRSNKVNRELKK
jgi:hypothetical protein